MARVKIDEETLENVNRQINSHTDLVLNKKGYNSFSSIHEILGVLAEEYREVEESIHLNNQDLLKLELLDVATTCIFAIASIDQNALDW